MKNIFYKNEIYKRGKEKYNLINKKQIIKNI